MIVNKSISSQTSSSAKSSISSLTQASRITSIILNGPSNEAQSIQTEKDFELNTQIENCKKRALDQTDISSESSYFHKLHHKAVKHDTKSIIDEKNIIDNNSKVFEKSLDASRSTVNIVRNLTLNLSEVYKKINRHYFEQKKLKNQIVVIPGTSTSIEGQIVRLAKGVIHIEQSIGEGTYGVVHEGRYHLYGSTDFIKVAFKINKFVSNNHLAIANIQHEASILNLLKQYDKSDLMSCILDEGFFGNRYYGIVQQLYSISLYDALRQTGFKGFMLFETAKFGLQLIKSLRLLKQTQVNLVHADIKPKNILLERPTQTKIRLIDFGFANRPVDKHLPNLYICSRYYRPPEAVFKMSYDQSFDIWSVGCVIFELHTGSPLFPAKSSDELIQMIIELLGPPPKKFIQKIPNWQNYFIPSKTDPEKYIYIMQKPLELTDVNRRQFFEECLSVEKTIKGRYSGKAFFYHTEEAYDLFKQLLRSMIAWDPVDRLTAKDLNSHPFFQKIIDLHQEFEQQKLVRQDIIDAVEDREDQKDHAAV